MKMKKSIAFIIMILVGLMFAFASGPSQKLVDIKNIKYLAPGEKPGDGPNLTKLDGQGVKLDIDFGKIPLYFIFNKGQVNEKAKFYAKASRYTLWLTGGGLVFDGNRQVEEGKQGTDDRRQIEDRKNETNKNPHSPYSTKIERDVSRLIFLNANKNPGMVPIDEAKLRVNYFIGNDKSKWHCDVPTSMAVLYKNLYKSIDLKVYGIEKQIEYDWIVKPTGNPGDISFAYKNVKGTRIDEEGNLLIETDFGELMHKKPVSYQMSRAPGAKRIAQSKKYLAKNETRGIQRSTPCAVRCALCDTRSVQKAKDTEERIEVNVKFKKIGKNTYGFEVGAYDRSRELIIDPVVLAYSTYLGGGKYDYGYGIAVDGSGNAYVTGETDSTNFPTLDQYQAYQGSYDVFVTRLDTTQSGASGLLYSTYLGGVGGDFGRDIAVDGSGNAYVTGWTISTDFPTFNQYQGDQGSHDVFVSRISVSSPTVDTPTNSNITYTTATLGGNVSNTNGANVMERGVYWSMTNGFTPPGQGTKVSETGNWGTGSFTVAVTGLPSGTTIYFKAFATNSAGTGYSTQDSFTTPITAPTITTTAVSNITSNSADSGGNVTSDGGAAVTARGVCWSTSANPTTADSHTTDGTGIGSFTSSLTGLTLNTTYYVRAYASNIAGIGYGDEITFTTTAKLTISGTVTDGTNPVEGVTITFSHDGHTETTDANGNYSYTVAYGTSTTVTASKLEYAFEPSEYSYTNLTEDKPNQDFTALNFISVTITNPQNGGTVSGVVIINAEVSSQDAKVEFYIDGVFVKKDTRPPYQHRWDTTLVSNGNHTIEAMAYHSSGLTNQHAIMVNVSNSTDPPHIVLNRTRLNFGAVIGEPPSGSQTFLITNSGGGALNWTASASETWIQTSPLNGTANTQVSVSVDITGLDTGNYAGTVTITDANADNSPVAVNIFLTVNDEGEDLPLIGSIDSPIDGSTVSGSISVTGWALDDTEISSVKIYRHPIWGQELGLVYIGEAVFVEGARPDVEIQYPQYPRNYRAGWGYMLLTNLLPNKGNGTFVITAIATGSSSSEVVLGSKTIICDNENSTKPFGTIDTPKEGGEASGVNFINFGWALTPQPNTIPTDGSTIKVWVDGVPLPGNPVYNQYREDIADTFPGYNNSNGAVGYYYLDTTLYANGVHTISWSVTDDAGNTDGIGSRYFRVMNVANYSADSSAAFGYKFGYSDKLPNPNASVSNTPIYLKKGYNTGVKGEQQTETIYPDKEGIINMDIKENERIEIEVGPRYRGYLIVDDQLRGLPVGSTMDMKKGVFSWQPVPGFIGEYQLVFVERELNGQMNRRKINITIRPKY